MHEKPLTGSAAKVQEYVDRIKNGESKESIMQGLPPSFSNAIEAGLSTQDIQKKEKADEKKLEQVKAALGMKVEKPPADFSTPEAMVKYLSAGRSQAVKDLYDRFLKEINDPEIRQGFAYGAIKDAYNKYRQAEYPVNMEEQQMWEAALKDTRVTVDTRNPDWMYRGIIPAKGQETTTRGSLNVEVTPELIQALDQLIIDGKFKGNYKFGVPNTGASPTERHDSISLYFLEEPSEELLKEIANIAKPYVRGDNLLGKKFSDGFYMSEVGSIGTPHIEALVKDLEIVDPAVAKAIHSYLSPKHGQGTQLKMSEAAFYAVKDVLGAFGHNFTYDNKLGFTLK